MTFNVDSGTFESRDASPMPPAHSRADNNVSRGSYSSRDASPFTRTFSGASGSVPRALFSSASPATSISGAASDHRDRRLNSYFDDVEKATKASKPEKSQSPWDNPLGLDLTLKVLHSLGDRLEGGYFKATKTTPLDDVTPRTIPWATWKGILKRRFLNEYITPYITKSVTPLDMRIGVSYEKDKAHKATTGRFNAVDREDSNWEAMESFLSPDSGIPWAIESGRVIVWIDLRYNNPKEDKPPYKPLNKPSKRRGRPPKAQQKAASKDPRGLQWGPVVDISDSEGIKSEEDTYVISPDTFPNDNEYAQQEEVEEEEEAEEEVDEIQQLPRLEEETDEASVEPVANLDPDEGYEDAIAIEAAAASIQDLHTNKRQKRNHVVNNQVGRGRRSGRTRRATSKARLS